MYVLKRDNSDGLSSLQPGSGMEGLWRSGGVNVALAQGLALWARFGHKPCSQRGCHEGSGGSCGHAPSFLIQDLFGVKRDLLYEF